MVTSRTHAMFSFQVVPLMISRSSLLLAMLGTSVGAYLTPSALLPLAHAQAACPAVTEYVPDAPLAATVLLVNVARASFTYRFRSFVERLRVPCRCLRQTEPIRSLAWHRSKLASHPGRPGRRLGVRSFPNPAGRR